MAGRLLFFGTPAFAVPTLEALCAAGRAPLAVVTQPARPAGRGRRDRQPPVAEWALARGLELSQPERVRDPAFLERAAALAPEVAVVVAFGQIFPPALLRIPVHGCINLHASLLPRHRGAAPVQAALLAGDRRTGVTTMLMEEGLDTGPTLLQQGTPIAPRETAGELAERLAALGAGLMVRTLDALAAGRLEPRPQVESEATYAPRLRREDGAVDWSLEAERLFDRLRALTPWPGLHAVLRDRPVKLLWGRPAGAAGRDAPPGTILGIQDERLLVACGGGSAFAVDRLQRPGRRALPAPEFANGERLRPGERFG